MNYEAGQMIENLPPPYCYYAYVASRSGAVDYMHYGYWRNDTETLFDAQENLASLMKSYIPGSVRRILDSGCGLGRTTRDFTKSGFDVIGISPDRGLLLEAQNKYPEIRERFICSSLEKYEEDEKFDLIYFQESSQYIDVRILFHKCAKLVRQDGFLLVCDEVRYSRNGRLFNRKADMLRFSSMNGFNILHNQSITSDVLPTRKYFTRILRDNIDDVLELFSSTGRDVKKEVLALIDAWDHDTELFENHNYGYELFLFQKTARGRSMISNVLVSSIYALGRKWRSISNLLLRRL